MAWGTRQMPRRETLCCARNPNEHASAGPREWPTRAPHCPGPSAHTWPEAEVSGVAHQAAENGPTGAPSRFSARRQWSLRQQSQTKGGERRPDLRSSRGGDAREERSRGRCEHGPPWPARGRRDPRTETQADGRSATDPRLPAKAAVDRATPTPTKPEPCVLGQSRRTGV